MSQGSAQEAAIGAPYVSHPANRAVIFDRGSDTFEANLRMPLLLYSDDDADTFVYIEPAPQEVDEVRRSHSYSWGPSPSLLAKTQPIPHRIHSRKLLATGSDVLKDLFRPRNQARVRKRYGLTHDMPPGVKYAIDLTPPSEGDEAVIFMTELSCPMGVRKWATLESSWKLPSICVGGQDEVEWNSAPNLVDTMEPKVINAYDVGTEKATQDQPGESDSEKKQLKKIAPRPRPRILNMRGELPTLRADLDPTPSDPGDEEDETEETTVQNESKYSNPAKKISGLPLDYSPIRHRTCLERVLHALEGLDPKLDTAPKLWTFFALAKLLQVTTHPAISDHILIWMYQGNNSLFVEVNPELAYQIACGLQNPSLCRDSFAILVGEEALSALVSSVMGLVPKRTACTIHGRNREPLDDTEVQRVEYASKVFLERVLNEFVKLAGTEMLWVEKIVTENIRGPFQMQENKIYVDDLVDFCKTYVRGQIYQFLTQHHAQNTNYQFYSVSETEYPGLDYHTVQSRMPLFCRILTRAFWKNLGDISLLTDVHVRNWEHWSLKGLAPKLPNLRDQEKAILRKVSSNEVDRAISNFLHAVNSDTPPSEGWSNAYFDFTYFQNDVTVYLQGLSSHMVNSANDEHTETTIRSFSTHQCDIVDTLVCLGEEEFKFLPLWAEGNDDGTGGVFDDQTVPVMKDGGFATAGPPVRLASDHNDDTSSMSSFDTIHPDDAASTIGRASHEATASHATTTIVSATTSVSDFELLGPVRDMDIRSNRSATEDDLDIEMSTDADGDFEFLDDNDDDDDDTIGTMSDMDEV